MDIYIIMDVNKSTTIFNEKRKYSIIRFVCILNGIIRICLENLLRNIDGNVPLPFIETLHFASICILLLREKKYISKRYSMNYLLFNA